MAARPPNLVLIGIDSLRADHMSLYGYDRLTTPHVDRWARTGTVFERAFSPNIPTTSGYTAMFTGYGKLLIIVGACYMAAYYLFKRNPGTMVGGRW